MVLKGKIHEIESITRKIYPSGKVGKWSKPSKSKVITLDSEIKPSRINIDLRKIISEKELKEYQKQNMSFGEGEYWEKNELLSLVVKEKAKKIKEYKEHENNQIREFQEASDIISNQDENNNFSDFDNEIEKIKLIEKYPKEYKDFIKNINIVQSKEDKNIFELVYKNTKFGFIEIESN